MDISEITSELLSKSPKGASCIFVNLDGDRGLKLYTSRQDAVECRWRQRLAYQHGLAPKVFGKTELTIGGRHYYGYVTEVADVVPYIDGRLTLPDEAQLLIEESTDFEVLKDNLREIDLGGDLGTRNIGWINGKMVCIDFSWHSVW